MRSLNVEGPAPIAFFASRRPEHLHRTPEALRVNPEGPRTELHIFSEFKSIALAAPGGLFDAP
jgi:hypothetical protein